MSDLNLGQEFRDSAFLVKLISGELIVSNVNVDPKNEYFIFNNAHQVGLTYEGEQVLVPFLYNEISVPITHFNIKKENAVFTISLKEYPTLLTSFELAVAQTLQLDTTKVIM